MTNRTRAIALLSLLIGFCVCALAAEDWTRFRGPNGTGVSSETNLPTDFGPDKSVVWKTVLPPGHSSPVLSRTRIFVTAHDGDKKSGKLLVIALDRKTGKELWRREVPRAKTGRLENVNGPASASPVTDGENVFAYFQDFGLISFNAAGKERWRLPIEAPNIFYGYGASPILVDDKVILPVDQDGGAYLALGEMDKELPRIVGGNLDRAITRLEAGLKIAPHNLELKLALAEAYKEDGRKEDARRQLQEILSRPVSVSRAKAESHVQEKARKLLGKL